MPSKMMRYFFPPRRKQDYVPLVTTEFSGNRGYVDEKLLDDINLLILARCARTRQDAQLLIRRHSDLNVTEIIALYTRKRRRKNILAMFWQRFTKLFNKPSDAAQMQRIKELIKTQKGGEGNNGSL